MRQQPVLRSLLLSGGIAAASVLFVSSLVTAPAIAGGFGGGGHGGGGFGGGGFRAGAGFRAGPMARPLIQPGRFGYRRGFRGGGRFGVAGQGPAGPVAGQRPAGMNQQLPPDFFGGRTSFYGLYSGQGGYPQPGVGRYPRAAGFGPYANRGPGRSDEGGFGYGTYGGGYGGAYGGSYGAGFAGSGYDGAYYPAYSEANVAPYAPPRIIEIGRAGAGAKHSGRPHSAGSALGDHHARDRRTDGRRPVVTYGTGIGADYDGRAASRVTLNGRGPTDPFAPQIVRVEVPSAR